MAHNSHQLTAAYSYLYISKTYRPFRVNTRAILESAMDNSDQHVHAQWIMALFREHADPLFLWVIPLKTNWR